MGFSKRQCYTVLAKVIAVAAVILLDSSSTAIGQSRIEYDLPPSRSPVLSKNYNWSLGLSMSRAWIPRKLFFARNAIQSFQCRQRFKLDLGAALCQCGDGAVGCGLRRTAKFAKWFHPRSLGKSNADVRRLRLRSKQDSSLQLLTGRFG